MAAKRKPKTRHGATQPEEARARKGVLVRLSTGELAEVDAYAAGQSLTRSDAIVHAVRRASRDRGVEQETKR